MGYGSSGMNFKDETTWDILQLIMSGKKPKEVAYQYGLNPQTVRAIVQRHLQARYSLKETSKFNKLTLSGRGVPDTIK